VTEGLERFHDRVEPPGFGLFVACWFQPMEPFGGVGHRPHVCLNDDVLRGGGTHDLAEPAQVRGVPGGAAGLPEIMPEQEGFEATLGRLQIVERIFPRPAQVTHGFVCDRGDRDRRELPGAPQPGQLAGIPTISCDAVARLLGEHGGGDDPAGVAFWGQLAVEPGATGSRFRDEDQVLGFGVRRAHEVIDVALPSANGAQGDDLRVVLSGDRGDREGILVDIQPSRECARVRHG